MVNDCKAWREMTDKVNTDLENGKASAQKMTLHDEQDKAYTEMKARWTEVDKSCKEWTTKLEELSGMWTKQTGKPWREIGVEKISLNSIFVAIALVAIPSVFWIQRFLQRQ